MINKKDKSIKSICLIICSIMVISSLLFIPGPRSGTTTGLDFEIEDNENYIGSLLSVPPPTLTKTLDVKTGMATRGGGAIKSKESFSTGSTRFTIVGEPKGDVINLAIPPDVNVTSATMSVTGMTRELINIYKVGQYPVFISSADFNKDGDLDLLTTDLYNEKIYLSFGGEERTFHSTTHYPTGDLPIWGTINDFNNDNYPDVAVVNEGANSITVYQNSKSEPGTLENRKDYKIGDIPRSITSADFNGDGWIDLASVSSNDDKVWISLNQQKESVTFNEAENLTVEGIPVDIVSGDLNNDGYPDLAVINVGANITLGGVRYYNGISVLINDGHAKFQAQNEYLVGKKPAKVILDDFNKDSLLDIATSNRASRDISVLLNKGKGAFHNSINYSMIDKGSPGQSLTSGDIDGDGDIDILSLCASNNTIEMFRNKGDGTFLKFEEFIGGHSPADLLLGDFDLDCDLDLATPNLNDGTITIISNNGNGVFKTNEFYRVGGWPRGIKHGDVDNDGDLDIVTANYLGGSISIMYNDGGGYFPRRYDRHICVEPFAVITDDFDKDGYLDLVSADEGLFELVIIYNDGDGNYEKREKLSYNLGGYPYAIIYHDFNKDGRKDLITSNNLQQSISILWNNGNESMDTFAPFENISFENQHPFGLAYGDMDGDGDDDLICTNLGFESAPEDFISILWNDGNGSFSKQTDYKVGTNPINLMAKDLDNDGDLDLAVANMDSNSTTILMNQDNKTFGERKDYPVGPLPMGIEMADFNYDGHMDIIIGNHGNDSISILYNNGDGTFQPHLEFPSGPQPTYITIADFNKDGNLDVATPNKLSSTISVHLDLGYPGNISVEIGDSSGFFKYNGHLAKTVELPDFTEQLNSYLIEHKNDYIQTQNGPAVIIPINVKSDIVGILEFSNLKVEYISPNDFDGDDLSDDLDPDDDNDGLPDTWETTNGFNSKDAADSSLDTDNDNLTNLEEFLNSTDPNLADSDGDGLEDGEEWKIYGTDPLNEDTDGDDFTDSEEINKKTDPLDPKDFPKKKDGNSGFIPGFGIEIIATVMILVLVFNKFGRDIRKIKNKKNHKFD